MEKESLQLVFSGTKGLVAVCVLMLIDRGWWNSTHRSTATGESSASPISVSATSSAIRHASPASMLRCRSPR